MPNSQIDPAYVYDHTTWLLSYLNIGDKLGGHAVLIIEGLRAVEGQPNQYQQEFHLCHIRAAPVEIYFSHPEMLGLSISEIESAAIQETTQNLPDKKFIVCYIQCKKALSVDYEPYTKRTEKINAAAGANLLEQIQTEEQAIKERARQALTIFSQGQSIDPIAVSQYFTLYKKYGRRSILVEGVGINCADWCDDQLQKVGLQPMFSCTDSTTAFPSNHARPGKCIIL